jgi:putative membrane protein
MKILVRLVVNALIVLLIAELVPGIDVTGFFTALLVALALAIVNVTLKPILFILTLPITLVTLGLFTFIINAFLLWFVALIIKGFDITGFFPALLGSLLMSLAHIALHRLESRGSVYNH